MSICPSDQSPCFNASQFGIQSPPPAVVGNVPAANVFVPLDGKNARNGNSGFPAGSLPLSTFASTVEDVLGMLANLSLGFPGSILAWDDNLKAFTPQGFGNAMVSAFPSAANGNIIQYNAAQGKWVNVDLPTAVQATGKVLLNAPLATQAGFIPVANSSGGYDLTPACTAIAPCLAGLATQASVTALGAQITTLDAAAIKKSAPLVAGEPLVATAAGTAASSSTGVLAPKPVGAADAGKVATVNPTGTGFVLSTPVVPTPPSSADVPLSAPIAGLSEPPGSATPADDVQAALAALARRDGILPTPNNATGDGYLVPAAANGMFYIDPTTGKAVLDRPEFWLGSGGTALPLPQSGTYTPLTVAAVAGQTLGSGTYSGTKYTVATKGLYSITGRSFVSVTATPGGAGVFLATHLKIAGSITADLFASESLTTTAGMNNSFILAATGERLLSPGDTIELGNSSLSTVAGITSQAQGYELTVTKIRSIG